MNDYDDTPFRWEVKDKGEPQPSQRRIVMFASEALRLGSDQNIADELRRRMVLEGWKTGQTASVDRLDDGCVVAEFVVSNEPEEFCT